MTLKEIELRDTVDCEVCDHEIGNVDSCLLLTPTERYILDITDGPKDGGLLLVCDRCFEDMIYTFKSHHRLETFGIYKNTELDYKISDLEYILN